MELGRGVFKGLLPNSQRMHSFVISLPYSIYFFGNPRDNYRLGHDWINQNRVLIYSKGHFQKKYWHAKEKIPKMLAAKLSSHFQELQLVPILGCETCGAVIKCQVEDKNWLELQPPCFHWSYVGKLLGHSRKKNWPKSGRRLSLTFFFFSFAHELFLCQNRITDNVT